MNDRSGPAVKRVSKAVGRWLDHYLSVGKRVTVACSGGADSLALAIAAQIETNRQGYQLAAVTVDHQLQPGSAERAQSTAKILQGIGFGQVDVITVNVGRSGGPEAAARQARYDALHPAAAGGAILLGHTLDDQAETVLLGLGRGSGPRSIQGMQPYNKPYGRPLLDLRRSDTEAACEEFGVTPWIDPHNSDPAFTRVRLRHEVLPLLEEVLGGGVSQSLARTAVQLREDGEVLDQLATALLRGCIAPGNPSGFAITFEALAAEPVALRRRVLRLWLKTGGVTGVTAEHLARLDRLVQQAQAADRKGQTPAGAVRLPGHLDAVADAGKLHLRLAR